MIPIRYGDTTISEQVARTIGDVRKCLREFVRPDWVGVAHSDGLVKFDGFLNFARSSNPLLTSVHRSMPLMEASYKPSRLALDEPRGGEWLHSQLWRLDSDCKPLI